MYRLVLVSSDGRAYRLNSNIVLVTVLLCLSLLPTSSTDIFQESPSYLFVYLPIVHYTKITQRGVAKTAIYGDCGDLTQVGVEWYYNWWMSPEICPEVEAVPMISCWQTAEAVIAGTRLIEGNSQWIMLFNEPDLISPITPRRGAELTRDLLPFLNGRKVLAPCPSEMGMEWLPAYRQQYIALYSEPPPMDGLAVHCYRNNSTRCIATVERMLGWAEEWGVPEVWVTEFSFAPNGRDEAAMMVEAQAFIHWIIQEPRVTRYAWFTNRMLYFNWSVSPLLDFETDELTEWGEMYREVR